MRINKEKKRTKNVDINNEKKKEKKILRTFFRYRFKAEKNK